MHPVFRLNQHAPACCALRPEPCQDLSRQALYSRHSCAVAHPPQDSVWGKDEQPFPYHNLFTKLTDWNKGAMLDPDVLGLFQGMTLKVGTSANVATLFFVASSPVEREERHIGLGGIPARILDTALKLGRTVRGLCDVCNESLTRV